MQTIHVGDSVQWSDNGRLSFGIVRSIEDGFLSISDVRRQVGDRYPETGVDAVLRVGTVRPLTQLGVRL